MISHKSTHNFYFISGVILEVSIFMTSPTFICRGSIRFFNFFHLLYWIDVAVISRCYNIARMIYEFNIYYLFQEYILSLIINYNIYSLYVSVSRKWKLDVRIMSIDFQKIYYLTKIKIILLIYSLKLFIRNANWTSYVKI